MKSLPAFVAPVLLLVLTTCPPGVSEAQDDRPTAIGGRIISSATARPVIGAKILLVETDESTFTDIEGSFRFQVEPGEYQLKITAPGFTTFLLTEIVADPGEPADVRVPLDPTGEIVSDELEPKNDDAAGATTPDAVEEIVVTATATKANEAFALVERQTADVVKDTISSDFFKKAPDSDVGEIVQRLAAVNVQDDYVFVRGLGSRYSTAVLNGSRLPSPNPNVRVVPLDLFPADFVESLAIIKTYSPNLQGDFSGGLIDINLKPYPSDFTWKIGMKIGGNTQSTFQDFRTYETAREAPDFFGIDTSRQLPGVFGDERITITSQEQAALFAGALENIWSPETITAPINSGLNFEIGDSFGDWGYNFTALWSNDYQTVNDEIQRQFQNQATPPDQPDPQLAEDFVYDTSTFSTRLGAILTTGWDIDERNRVAGRALYQRLTSDTVLEGSGFRRQNDEITLDTTRLEYQKEDIAFGQLAGEHILAETIEVDWRTAFGRTSLDRPDVRTTAYESTMENPVPVYARTAGSGTRIWLDVEELMSDSQGDFAFPFEVWDYMEARFHLGGAFTWRDRESNMRRFLFRPVSTSDTDLLRMRPEAFLNEEKVASGFTNFFEETAPQDSFSASEQIIAGYAMLELPIVENFLRFSGGLRGENSVIDITFFRQDLQGEEQSRSLVNLDPMPAANFIFTPTDDMNVRAAYSRTVSRPEFRELSPIFFPEPFGLRTVVGNPNLIQSTIDSFDLRWDWFFSGLELASLSAFYKQIDDPIERIVVSLAGTPATSFDNSEDAWLLGFEAELRKDFGFVHDELQNLMIFLNASWIKSEATRGERQDGETSNQLSASRDLQGQAPFVVNTTLQYAHDELGVFRLLYNTKGETLAELGETGLPDILEARRDQLDFVWTNEIDFVDWPVAVKFAVENLLDDRYLWTQDGTVQRRFQSGLTFSLSGSYRW